MTSTMTTVRDAGSEIFPQDRFRNALRHAAQWTDRPSGSPRLLDTMLRGRLDRLAEVAVDLCSETGPTLGRHLARRLEEDGDRALAERVMDACDREARQLAGSLREVSLAATRKALEGLAEAHRLDATRRRLEEARLTYNLATRYSQGGDPDASLQHHRTAVDLLRGMECEGVEVRHRLGIALDGLAQAFHAAGCDEDALAPAEEAVRLFEHLALDAAYPRDVRLELARSLDHLAQDLMALGRAEEGLASARRSLSLRRQLVAEDAARFEPDLALGLDNLGGSLLNLGRTEEAFPLILEAVELRRARAGEDPDSFLEDLATSLHHLSLVLERRECLEEALQAAEEAVRLRRRLREKFTSLIAKRLAASLERTGTLLHALERAQPAVAAWQEAAKVLAELGRVDPRRFADEAGYLVLSAVALSFRELGLSELEAEAHRNIVETGWVLAGRCDPMCAMCVCKAAVRLAELQPGQARHWLRKGLAVARGSAPSTGEAATRPEVVGLLLLGGALREIGEQDAADEALRRVDELLAATSAGGGDTDPTLPMDRETAGSRVLNEREVSV